jgi:PAS domain S-box-containing protein
LRALRQCTRPRSEGGPVISHPVPGREHDLDDFFEHGAMPLHLVGPDGTILKANRAELELLGYRPEEYVGRNIVEFHVDRPAIDDILARLARGEVVRDHPARLRARDGSIKHVLIDSSVHWEHGEFVNTRCFTRDVTEITRLQEEHVALLERERVARAHAEALNRAKDEFLATLSHELRTPLNAILGWARMLELGAHDPAVMHKAVRVIARNAELQAHLIEDLLDMSRVVTGKLVLELQPVSLVSVIEAAVETVKPVCEAKGVALRVSLDPCATTLSGDPARLQQVVWNLLSNAIKFTPSGGWIAVTLEYQHDHAQVTLTDSGAGIDAGLLPFVFERFRQGDSSTTRTHGGLGIGLALVRHFVELHGGAVSACSDGEGKGATFVVTLPLTAPAPGVRDGVLAPGAASAPP